MYEILADVVLWIHGFFFVFVLVGGFATNRSKRFQQIIAILLVSTLVSWAIFLDCPLTVLENELRRMHDPSVPARGPAISRLVNQLLGLEVPPEAVTCGIMLLAAYVVYQLWRN